MGDGAGRGVAGGHGLDPEDAVLLAKLAVACFEVAQQRWLESAGRSLPALVDEVSARLPELLRGRITP